MKTIVLFLFVSICSYAQTVEKPTNEQYFFLKTVNESYPEVPVPDTLQNFYEGGNLYRCEFSFNEGNTKGGYIYFPSLNKITYVIIQGKTVLTGDIYYMHKSLYKTQFVATDESLAFKTFVGQKVVYSKK